MCITCRKEDRGQKRRAKSDLLGQPSLQRSRTIPSPIVYVSLLALLVTNQI
jgi:hypothetical protein